MKTIFTSYYYIFSKKMEGSSIGFMRVALAVIYIWFGILKIFEMSPATDLVAKTVTWFKPEFFIPVLGFLELMIGLGLLVKRMIPLAVTLLLLHMIATMMPFFVLQSACFNVFPLEPTLEGQYIIKNLVLISGALIIAGKYNEAYYNEMNLKKEQPKFIKKALSETEFLTE